MEVAAVRLVGGAYDSAHSLGFSAQPFEQRVQECRLAYVNAPVCVPMLRDAERERVEQTTRYIEIQLDTLPSV